VALNASPGAKHVYDVLTMHLNYQRGDRLCWPVRDVLAKILGYKQAKSVDPYVTELKELGAIEVTRSRTKDGLRWRNVYLVHFDPPDGFKGIASLDAFYAWYEANGEGEQDETAGGSRYPLQRTTKEPGETAGGSRYPLQRTTDGDLPGSPWSAPADLGSPLQRTSVVRSSGPEQDELKQDELNKKKTTAGSSSTVASAPFEDSPARDQAKHKDHQQPNDEAQLTLGDEPDLPGAEVAVVDKTGPDAEARQLARDWLGYLDAQGTPPVKRKNGSPFWALAVPYRSAIEQGYTRDEIWAAMIAMYETRQTTVPTAELLSRALVQVRQRASVVATASPEILATADEILRQFAEFNGGVVLNGSRPRAVGQIVDALQNGATPERVALALQMCGEPAPPGWKFQRALFGKLPGASARQEDRDAVFVIGAAAAAAYDAAHGEASDLSANTTGGS
jgi:hypothetical protein